ncbi:MAG: lysylphosphatidylglycerol synthase transmembrane domain-containing protein [Pirellulales bacterium]
MTCQGILRWTIPPAIVAYLVYDVQRQDSFDQIWSGEKNWTLLGVALLAFLAAQLLTIARWYWLVRALDLPFRWNDAVRLGFLGYLLTFVSLGAVGGDLLKAFFVAREQPRRRIEAFATVIVDRILGLYSLLLLAAVSIVVSGIWQSPPSAAVGILCQTVFGTTAVATIAILFLLSLGGNRAQGFFGPLFDRLARIPKVGAVLKPLAGAVQVYRRDLPTVATSIVVGLLSQFLLAACVWAIAGALLPNAPSIGEHVILVPLALLTTVLPLPGYGLGAFEMAVEFLYRHVGSSAAGGGLLVALGFRLVMVVTAMISAVIYATHRREVGDVLREAHDECERLAASANM